MTLEHAPKVLDADKVGTYSAASFSGGGYVWDEVLEYRVWCHPEQGAEDLEDGSDYYYAFVDYEDALSFSKNHQGTEEPIALVLQREYINEPSAGEYLHIKQERITEWPVEFLSRPRRTEDTIPDFMADDAPPNRLDIIRGIA
ncbi:MAG: GCN5 family acetyltransferase [Pseudomonadota bacterium]